MVIMFNTVSSTDESQLITKPGHATDEFETLSARQPILLAQVLADLTRFTEEFGPYHLKVAEAWNSLGLIRLHIQADPEEAIKCQKEALVIQRLSTPSVELAATLNDLALCYERIGESEHALELYLEAEGVLRICSPSPSHPVCLCTDRCIARLQRR